MSKDYKMIFQVANSLCELNGYSMERLDIQKWKIGSITGYSGYLNIGNNECIIIREDGSFQKHEDDKIIK